MSQSIQTLYHLFCLDIFFITQFCFDENLPFILTFVPHYCDCMQHILKTISKSRHLHLSISIDTAKFYISLTKVFWKNKIFITNRTLVLNYLALCYNYSFLYGLFFIHPDASIGVIEKRLFEYLELK